MLACRLQPILYPPWLAAGVDARLLRLDELDPVLSGNKPFKLGAVAEVAAAAGAHTLATVGGPWSNHLHALAAFGQRRGWCTLGIVRGEPVDNAMLDDARRWGMQIMFASRALCRLPVAELLAALGVERAGVWPVAMGAGEATGVMGCRPIGETLLQRWPGVEVVALAVGSGATLAGVAAALPPRVRLLGICPAREAAGLREREIGRWLGAQGASARPFELLPTGPGFGRLSAAQQHFIKNWEATTGIPLDPVYTAKLMFRIDALIGAGDLPSGTRLALVHTGGLQGRRGFPALFSEEQAA